MNWIFRKTEILNIQKVIIFWIVLFMGILLITEFKVYLLVIYLVGMVVLFFAEEYIKRKYHSKKK